jgi:hypothetical protein
MSWRTVENEGNELTRRAAKLEMLREVRQEASACYLSFHFVTVIVWRITPT